MPLIRFSELALRKSGTPAALMLFRRSRADETIAAVLFYAVQTGKQHGRESKVGIA